MRSLNATAARLARLLRDHNLTRQQFIARYGLRPLVLTPELPARAKLALALAGGLIFALALLGNALVVYVVARSRAMRTVTNIFICNLALSDLLIAFFCIPVTTLQNISDNWLGGESAARRLRAAFQGTPDPPPPHTQFLGTPDFSLSNKGVRRRAQNFLTCTYSHISFIFDTRDSVQHAFLFLFFSPCLLGTRVKEPPRKGPGRAVGSRAAPQSFQPSFP